MTRKEMLDRLVNNEDPLELAIEDWGKTVSGKKRSRYEECALCEVYRGCEGCPVVEKTGDFGCRHTPYRAYKDAADGSEEKDAAALEEYEFLKSLRKKEE